MNCIGLIGGLGWESTVLYYQIINREVSQRLGRLHSASITIRSLDFERISGLQKSGDWKTMASILGDAGRALRAAGAQCILIGSNTMHRIADEVQNAAELPVLHIADATAEAILNTPARVVGLLGTCMTMEERFYHERMGQHGITCRVPQKEDRHEIHRIIFEELFLGQFREASRSRLKRMIEEMVEGGAQGIVLGCTELPLLISPEDCPVPLFNTTHLHALAGARFSLTGVRPRKIGVAT